MPKPNYAFAKRQRELAKKQKKEAKRLQKSPPSTQNPESVPPTPPESGQT